MMNNLVPAVALRFAGFSAAVRAADSDLSMTLPIETKASPEQRAGLHQMRRERAVERSVLLQPWVPDPSAPGGAGS